MKKICLSIILWTVSNVALAQSIDTRNVIIVTLDGLRWQEVFRGADPKILSDRRYTKDNDARATFRRTSAGESRQVLLPFLWNTVAEQGQLYGNRALGCNVDCANPHWFSYPGYSEMLTGLVDKRVKSNRKIENPNPTILEFLNRRDEFQGRVAAFGSWDVFPFIMREEKSGILVNAGGETATGELSETEQVLNGLQNAIQNSHGARHDVFTFQYAFEYLRSKRPRVLFIGFDETDHFAHQGRYDRYLKAANNADSLIASLWRWVQSDSQYRDNTTLLITTDHGRGKGTNNWRNHGRLVPGSGQVWFAVVGPATSAEGEMDHHVQYFLRQLAPTLVALVGCEPQTAGVIPSAVENAVGARLMTDR